MTEPGSSRAHPIDRPSGRALLVTPDHEVLLIRIPVDDRPFDTLWITPGGGLESGEGFAAATRREVWEETGLRLDEPGREVWVRRHVWPFQGRWYRSEERFFFSRVARFEPRPRALDPYEAALELRFRWWRLAALHASDEVFVPRRIAPLLAALANGDVPDTPLDTGV